MAKRAARLQRRKTQRRMGEASFAAIEQDVFLAAYCVRKLAEAKKLSDEVESISLRASAFAPREQPVDLMNWFKLDRAYDLTSSVPAEVSLRDWYNQVIHSFVFVVDTERTGLAGFYVSSDRLKHKRLLYFAADEVIGALARVADDDVVSVKMERDGSGAMQVVSKSNAIRGA
ncbi:MAG: hypothetical protein M3Y87_18215 [Myxococcota bacterium]|nr:hypothetical protein [Myxococcota bacterium]